MSAPQRAGMVPRATFEATIAKQYPQLTPEQVKAQADQMYGPVDTSQMLANTSDKGEIDQVNQRMRAQPWYQQLVSSWGMDPAKPGGLNDQQKQQLAQTAQQNGFTISQGHFDVDDNGNFRSTDSPWKTVGQVASMAAPLVAAPFTGGATLALIGAGSGAAGGALGGGGWKGALTGGALGALPGLGKMAGGAVASRVGQTAVRAGLGAAQGGLSGGGVKGALTGAGMSALSGANSAAGRFTSPLAQNLTRAGVGAASNALQGGGWTGAAMGAGTNLFNSYLPHTGAGGSTPGVSTPGSGGGMGINWSNLIGAGLGAYQGAQNGGGFGGAMSGAARGFVSTPNGTGTQAPNGQAPAGGWDMTASDPSWWNKWGPLVVQGGAAVGGILASRAAQNAALNRSPAEQAAYNAASSLAGANAARGDQMMTQGLNTLQAPTQYYQTLLNGNRAAMTQAVAPQIASLTDVYRGAARNLDQQGVQGAQRAQAVSELGRQRASQIAGLTTGVQPWAAGQLTGIGGNYLTQAPGYYQLAQGGYGSLLGNDYQNRLNAMNEGTKAGTAIGGMIRDIGQAIPGTQKQQPYQQAPAQTPRPTSGAGGSTQGGVLGMPQTTWDQIYPKSY